MIVHQWFNCNLMKLGEYFLCAKKTKIMTFFNSFSAVYRFPFLSLQVRGSESSQIFIKNILVCVPKINEGLTGLEKHEGK